MEGPRFLLQYQQDACSGRVLMWTAQRVCVICPLAAISGQAHEGGSTRMCSPFATTCQSVPTPGAFLS